jgi:dUTP pyrophosphatase
MKIKPLVKDFIIPEYKRELSGGMDIYLQQDITLSVGVDNVINLGFAAEVPEGHVALLLPRSSAGMKGIALRNTVGIIDADYRGEWIAHITLDSICDKPITYKRGERILQAVIVPFNKVEIELSDTLSQTGRGDTGFGGTGK